MSSQSDYDSDESYESDEELDNLKLKGILESSDEEEEEETYYRRKKHTHRKKHKKDSDEESDEEDEEDEDENDSDIYDTDDDDSGESVVVIKKRHVSLVKQMEIMEEAYMSMFDDIDEPTLESFLQKMEGETDDEFNYRVEITTKIYESEKEVLKLISIIMLGCMATNLRYKSVTYDSLINSKGVNSLYGSYI